MKEVEKNEHYKIITVELAAGTNMPRHLATSDAYVIVKSGDDLLVFKDEIYALSQGSNMTIPSHEPHLLKVIRDFKAFIVLAKDAVIDFAV